jgi:peroxin-19
MSSIPADAGAAKIEAEQQPAAPAKVEPTHTATVEDVDDVPDPDEDDLDDLDGKLWTEHMT